MADHAPLTDCGGSLCTNVGSQCDACIAESADHTPLTDEELAAIKARAEAATPGPWEGKAHKVYAEPGTDYGHGADRIIAACWRPWGPVTGDGSIEADTSFIAHARTDVPALVAEVERLRADNAQLEKWVPGGW